MTALLLFNGAGSGALGGAVPRDAVKNLGLVSFGDPPGSTTGDGSTPVAGAAKEGDPLTGTGTAKKDESPTEAFVLGEALPVVPAKLVRRILKAEYVDMAELLKDNMEAERRRWRAEGGQPQGHFTQRTPRREIPDVLSWLQCFNLYAAVVTSEHPEKTRELLAYQALMISEARRCGGRGWLLYDAAFRQQIRSFDSVDFAKVNQSLYSTTFLAYGGGRAKLCPDCMMADHTREECALNPARSLPVVQMKEPEGRSRVPEGKARKRGRAGPCYAWNDGKCTYPQCRYEHVCSKCLGEHRRASCRLEGDRRREPRPPGGPSQ